MTAMSTTQTKKLKVQRFRDLLAKLPKRLQIMKTKQNKTKQNKTKQKHTAGLKPAVMLTENM